MKKLIHLSNKKLINITAKKQSISIKPIGLWYGNDCNWLNWVKKNTGIDYKYKYEIKISITQIENKHKNKVLVLKSARDFDKFTIKYGVFKNNIIYIKWNDVSKHFGGIEVRNIRKRLIASKYVQKKFNLNYNVDELDYPILWTEYFDVDSGCIWNEKSVKSFYLSINK